METAQSTPGSREENLAVAEELIDDARAAANTAHARRREELARVPGLRAALEEARRACAEAKAAFDARWPQGRDGVNGTLNRLKKRLEDVSRELEGSRRKLAAAGMFAFSRRKELRETVAAKGGNRSPTPGRSAKDPVRLAGLREGLEACGRGATRRIGSRICAGTGGKPGGSPGAGGQGLLACPQHLLVQLRFPAPAGFSCESP